MRHYTFEGSLRELVEAFERIASLEGPQGPSGLFQGFNPLLKIAAFGSFMLSALVVNDPFPLLFMATSLIFMVAVARMDIGEFIFRSTFIPAFALIISLPVLFASGGTEILGIGGPAFHISITDQGLLKTLVFTSRVWVCVATIVLVTSTTDFMMLTRALRKIRVPALFVSIIFTTYRYVFLTLHEVYGLLLAKESRTFKSKRTLNVGTLRFLGDIFASLFIRAYERSERVYLAMVARGYGGMGDAIGDADFSYGLKDLGLVALVVTLDITAILLNAANLGWV